VFEKDVRQLNPKPISCKNFCAKSEEMMVTGSTALNGGKRVEKEKVHEANWLVTRQSGVPDEPSDSILSEYGLP